MTNDGLREVVPPPGRRRALARLRYLPLVVLVLAVVAATVLGVVKSRSEADTSSGASRTAAARATLPAVCAPPVDQGIRVEHWRDDDREAASEAAFARGLAGEKPGYIKGRGGWAFFTDLQAKDFSQAVGRERQGRREVARWNAYLSAMQSAVQAHGGRFYVMIAPAKWDVYPDRLPAWARDLRGTTSLDHLMAEHPELPFIDVRPALRAAKEPTYSPLNSHWTDYGGYVAWKAATRCLRADGAPAAVDVPKISGVERVDDLNEFSADGLALPAKPQWTRPVPAAPHPPTTTESIDSGRAIDVQPGNVVDMLQLPVRTRTTDAQSSKTLLVLRDSTGSALSPWWSTSFARTVQYQHSVGGTGASLDVAGLVEEVRPDIMIFTMTERYLSYDPPSS